MISSGHVLGPLYYRNALITPVSCEAGGREALICTIHTPRQRPSVGAACLTWSKLISLVKVQALIKLFVEQEEGIRHCFFLSCMMCSRNLKGKNLLFPLAHITSTTTDNNDFSALAPADSGVCKPRQESKILFCSVLLGSRCIVPWCALVHHHDRPVSKMAGTTTVRAVLRVCPFGFLAMFCTAPWASSGTSLLHHPLRRGVTCSPLPSPLAWPLPCV